MKLYQDIATGEIFAYEADGSQDHLIGEKRPYDGPLGPSAAPPALTREAFCVALIGAGILTEAEASEAALGTWPPKFEPALAGKTLLEKLTIKNRWRDTRSVPRDAALFADLLAFYATAKGLSPAQAKALGDAIFAGVSA